MYSKITLEPTINGIGLIFINPYLSVWYCCIIFQRSQRIIRLAVEEAEKFVTRRLSEYDNRLVFVRGLHINMTTFPIVDVKERRSNKIVE
jgi:hypothetical protein